MPKVVITLAIDPELLKDVDEFAKEDGRSRSGLICIALKKYIEG